MPSPTLTLIESYTVGAGGIASFTLGAGGTIPQTYTDLLLKCSTRASTSNNQYLFIQINGLTSQVSARILYATGTTASSYSVSNSTYLRGDQPDSTFTASTFANTEFYFPNYSSTSVNKSVSMDGVSEHNGSTLAQIELGAQLSASTAAITSLTLSLPNTGLFVANSTVYLYGIKNS